MPETLLDHALQLARKGFRVFPLAPRSKRPLVDRFTARSSVDETTIRKWWGKWPEANIGISLQGLLVIDVDGETGAESLAKLRERRELPPTATVITGSGGKHLFFKLPAGVRCIPRTLDAGTLKHFTDLDKIDLKGSGGLVVGAGSVNSKGNPYSWITEPESVADITPAPQWMINELCGPEKPEYLATLDGTITSDEDAELLATLLGRFPIVPGARNTMTAKACGWLLGRGVTQEKAQKAGLAWLAAQGRTDPEAADDLLRTLCKLYEKLAENDSSVYRFKDHEQAAVDYYQQQPGAGRALNRFSALPALSHGEELFLQALYCYVLYEVVVVGNDPQTLQMTDRQLMRVYKLLHGKELSWDTLGNRKRRFVTREGKPATDEVLKCLSAGVVGKSASVYAVTYDMGVSHGAKVGADASAHVGGAGGVPVVAGVSSPVPVSGVAPDAVFPVPRRVRRERRVAPLRVAAHVAPVGVPDRRAPAVAGVAGGTRAAEVVGEGLCDEALGKLMRILGDED